MRKRTRARKALKLLVISVLGIILVFPLVYAFLASFKTNSEILGSSRLLPEKFTLDGYINGWTGSGQVSFAAFLRNSFVLVLPVVALTCMSSISVAYGFSRFSFPFRNALFFTMLALMMLPASVLIIPRYLLYAQLGWVDSYKPFYIPAMLATSSFFVYMFVQFFRTLPRDMDEAATIDGCGSLGVLLRILLPLCKPSVISAVIFQFIWTWNDFFSQFIYISSVTKFTVSLGLRMSIDTSSGIQWNNVVAMSMVSMLPCVLLYLSLQKYFVEGIATTGLKG